MWMSPTTRTSLSGSRVGRRGCRRRWEIQALIGSLAVHGRELGDPKARPWRHGTVGARVSAEIPKRSGARSDGAASFWVDPAGGTAGPMRMADDGEPGTWTPFRVSGGGLTRLQLPRSDWYQQVLAPTRNEQYLHLEIALPGDHPALVTEWNKAMSHLQRAEKAYAAGDDPGVFQYLRAWLDALPGAKKNILDSISNDKKRRDLDNLLAKAGAYLHNGRHVADDGIEAGEFPVDRLDAAFAMDLMRVLLSHMSVMVAAGRERSR